jgi:SM-20-related protein
VPLTAADFRLHAVPGFLTRPTCAELVQELAASSAGEARVHGRVAGGAVEPATRSTMRVEPSPSLSERLAEMLQGLLAPLSAQFDIPLTTFEAPQVLRYRPGDFFVAHQDGNTGLMQGEREQRRNVSVVLFLNEDYGGGELVFTEWHPARPNGRFTVPAGVGTLVAFPSETTHEVTPVTHGHRYTVVSWLG